MHSLLDAGVVDEITLLVCPASRGKGTRIFEDRQDLKLVEATGFENGVALLRYEIKKKAESPHFRKNRTPAMLLVVGIGRRP